MEPNPVTPSKADGRNGESSETTAAGTPKSRPNTAGSSGAPSPLSKANTPLRPTEGARHALEKHFDAAGETTATRGMDGQIEPVVDVQTPEVSSKCGLLNWVAQTYKRNVKLSASNTGEQSHSCGQQVTRDLQKTRAKLARTQQSMHKARWFGEYSEENPDEYLLMQDLISLHKRGIQDVCVTIITDDEPFDVGPLVRPAGRAVIDHDHGLCLSIPEATEDDIEYLLENYSEESPEDWLQFQDLVAASRHKVQRASIAWLSQHHDSIPTSTLEEQEQEQEQEQEEEVEEVEGTKVLVERDGEQDHRLRHAARLEKVKSEAHLKAEPKQLDDDEALCSMYKSKRMLLKAHTENLERHLEDHNALRGGAGTSDGGGDSDLQCGVQDANLCDDLEDIEYNEEDPELWLLQQDLLALHKRGAEMVSVTILAFDEPPDVKHLLWPVGSGHLDLEHHYQHAAPYPEGNVDTWNEEDLELLDDYLFLKDLTAVQKAGADAVSILLVSHGDGAEEQLVRDCRRARKAGWEVSHLWESPCKSLLIAQ